MRAEDTRGIPDVTDTQTYELLANLRFVKRDGRFILQQARKVTTWSPNVRAEGAVATSIDMKWYDVPLVEGD